MTHRTNSVAMTAHTEQQLLELLVREDGQEDLCLATYRPSTGVTRSTALVAAAVPPEPGERHVHGNVTVTADYILRAAEVARNRNSGLVLLHSHPEGNRWQSVSGPDRETESSYAYLVREMTGYPLVGMTLATGDGTWSARQWDIGTGRHMDCSHSTSVRVIGDKLALSWNDNLRPPPKHTERQARTMSSWGERCQADLARRRVLVVGAGSIGLDVIVRLAASGIRQLTVMDFDMVELRNLDRLIGASSRDVWLKRQKIHVAHRESSRAATASDFKVEVSDFSICEPEGLSLALDHDIIFSCVDRPWPRSVLNALAYSDLIPVIDGGVSIDTFPDGSMRNATWRSHVIRPGRPCMSCSAQLDLARVALDRQGLLGDPRYIMGAGGSPEPGNQNVAVLSISGAASLLSQYVSLNVAPARIGEPGPIQYWLSSHHLEHLEVASRVHCPVESEESLGDQRATLTERHEQAEQLRELAHSPSTGVRFLRWLDDTAQTIGKVFDGALQERHRASSKSLWGGIRNLRLPFPHSS